MAAKSKRRKDTEPGARPARPGGGQAKVFRRKSCLFCKDKVREVDYKNVEQLHRYTSDRGKIRSRRMSGACRRHQRQVAVAIKRAREMAMLPYVVEGGGPPPSRSRSSAGPGRKAVSAQTRINPRAHSLVGGGAR